MFLSPESPSLHVFQPHWFVIVHPNQHPPCWKVWTRAIPPQDILTWLLPGCFLVSVQTLSESLSWLPTPYNCPTLTAVEMVLHLNPCQHLTHILPERRTFYCSLALSASSGSWNKKCTLEPPGEGRRGERAECSWRQFVIAFLDCQEFVLPMVKLLSNLLSFVEYSISFQWFFFKQNPSPFTGLWARLKASTCPCAF